MSTSDRVNDFGGVINAYEAVRRNGDGPPYYMNVTETILDHSEPNDASAEAVDMAGCSRTDIFYTLCGDGNNPRLCQLPETKR